MKSAIYRYISLSLLAAAALGWACGPARAAGVELTIWCGSIGQDLEFCKKDADRWASQTGNTVKYLSIPAAETDTLAYLRKVIAERSTPLDVVMIDVVWPGIFKDDLLDLKPYSKGAERSHFSTIIANNTIDSKLLAMPWFTDVGMLYYRKDLLLKYGEKVPETWAELTTIAQKIMQAERSAGNPAMQGYVFQAKPSESLTCNAIEWLASHGGGTVVDASGKPNASNPQAARALRTVAGWIGSIAPKEVLDYAEEASRDVFQKGNAVFMRNWSYAWALGQASGSPVQGRMAVAPLPRGEGGKSASTLGGWQLAVNRRTAHPQEAADLLLHMTSAPVQRERAIYGSYNPTITSLYRDAWILKSNPFARDLYDIFMGAVPRPSTPTGAQYADVSAAFWTATHSVLAGKSGADEALQKLDEQIGQNRRKPAR